jgi:glycosyltransferase involved in cell wall biosynthesis
VDQAALAAEENMPPLYLLPVIVPMRARAQRVREKSLLFVGGFKHAPNVDGIGWFVRDCWPSIQARVPEAELVVIGGDAPASVLALSAVPGVKLTGWVPDTAPFLDAAAVSIAPLRFGAGMKVKVIEALAAALPVVTTAFGAQGLGATSNVNIMVADDSAAFSDAVCKLLLDPALAEAIGTAGQQLSDQVCGIGRATMAIDAMLQSATRNRRTRSFRQFLGGLALHQGMAWRQSKTLRAWAALRFVWNR